MYRHVLSCGLALSALSAPLAAPAWAQEERAALLRAEEEYKKGAAHFKVGEFEKALLYFVRVYRVAPNPNLVYNMARAFEELGRLAEAADYYEEYLKLSPQAADRREVELTAKTLRALARGAQPTPEAPATPSAAPAPAPAPESGMSSRVFWGWSSLGAGVLLGVGGGAFAWRASSLSDEFHAARGAEALRLRDERTTAAGWADGLFVGGAVLAGVGVYLLVSEPAPSSSAPAVAVSPADVSLTWAF